MVEENVQQAGGVGLPPGTKLGRYEIREKIGVGGQAIVYKGYEAMLDRYVAIKQISSHLAEDVKFLERFRREAQILAKLGAEQPAIVTIHELLEDERGLFIVMEYVEGRRLEAILDDTGGAIEPKAALQILWRLAAALNAVHTSGIIHRDLKPSNIIVGEGLRATITDFGVAASVSGQTSMVLGTTKYMAPELFEGGDVDGRSDMYSLGFVAYEMLAGRSKFNEVFVDIVRDKHSEALRWMKWHGNETVQAPPLHEINPHVPVVLSNIVARMMAKDLSQRFESMEALGRAIKMSFSPRARAASAGGTPMVVAAPSSQQEIGPGDEGDELELEPSATAPIPKSSLSPRTKIILAAVIVLTGVGLGVGLAIRSARRIAEEENSAQGRFKRIWQAYDVDRKYEDAIGEIDNLVKEHPGTVQAAKASVIVHLCKGHLAMKTAVTADDWDAVKGAENDAADALKTIQKTRSDLVEWARTFGDDHVKKFALLRSSSWAFRNVMNEATALAKQELRREAIEALSGLTGLPLTPEQKKQTDDFRKQQYYEIFKTDVMKQINTAENDLKQGNRPEAKIVFLQAQALLESEAAKILPPKERKILSDQVVARLGELAEIAGMEQLVQAVANAESSGDKTALLKALKALDAVQPSPEHKKRMRTVESDLVFETIQKLVEGGKRTEAIAALDKRLKEDPDYPAAIALRAQLIESRDWDAMVQAGNAAFAAKDYAQALKLYKEATNVRVSPDVTTKMKECDFQMLLTAADELRNAKRYPEAMQAYEKVLAAHADQAATIQARVQQMQQNQLYETRIKQAEDAVRLRDFVKARKILETAKTGAPSRAGAVNILLNEVLYLENVHKGKDAMSANRFDEALGYFNIAKNKKDTPEVRDLIREAEQGKKTKTADDSR